MKKDIIVVLGCVCLLASCGQGEGTNSVTPNDSTSMADQTNVSSVMDTSVDTHAHSSNTTIMGIMDKSMRDMQGIHSTGDQDVDFANTMKLHHMSAIEASQLVLQRGSDPAIKAMALKMLQDQQREVEEFENYIAGKNKKGNDSTFFIQSMSAMHKMNMDMDHSGSVDKQFVVMMIPHHQGAIVMSELYLKSGRDALMKKMAGDIISTQKKEISELKTWLTRMK